MLLPRATPLSCDSSSASVGNGLIAPSRVRLGPDDDDSGVVVNR